jgi:hypothetical protein
VVSTRLEVSNTYVSTYVRERASEVSPSPGERAGLDHDKHVIDSFEDVDQDMIRECADPVFFLVVLRNKIIIPSENKCLFDRSIIPRLTSYFVLKN